MDNEDNLSTEQVLNNTLNETVSRVCDNLNENTAHSPFSKVKKYKLENPKNITVSHLKFNSIKELIKSKLNIFLVSETKIDSSFPNQQFSIDGYRIYRRGRSSFSGGLFT